MTRNADSAARGTTATRSGQVRIRLLAELKPAPENDLLYRPIDAKDPEIRALVSSIVEHGVREPLVITLDDYILSGHRRRVACLQACVDKVPVRGEYIFHDDPQFVPPLREYNRQRVKSRDEVLREEALVIDPHEAHRLLREHREREAHIDVEPIDLEGMQRRARISQAKRPFLEAALRIIHDYSRYWPLSDR